MVRRIRSLVLFLLALAFVSATPLFIGDPMMTRVLLGAATVAFALAIF